MTISIMNTCVTEQRIYFEDYEENFLQTNHWKNCNTLNIIRGIH